MHCSCKASITKGSKSMHTLFHVYCTYIDRSNIYYTYLHSYTVHVCKYICMYACRLLCYLIMVHMYVRMFVFFARVTLVHGTTCIPTYVCYLNMKWLCALFCESYISKMAWLCCFFAGCPEPVSLPHWLPAATKWGLQDDRGLPDVSWPHRYSSMCREACTGHNWDCVRLPLQ